MKTLTLLAILCAGTTLLGQTPTKAQAAQDCANYRALQIARGATPDQVKRMDACGIVKPEDVPECLKCKPTDCEKFDGTTYTPAPCDAQTDWPQIVRTQGSITPAEQAAFPVNAWMKPCGPTNHDDWCVDMSAPPAPDTRICWDGRSPAGPTKDNEADCKRWGNAWIHVCETYDAKMDDFPVVPCFPAPEKAASPPAGWDGCLSLGTGKPCSDLAPITDVPPVTVTYWEDSYVICTETCPAPRTSDTPFDGAVQRTHLTCADKARFLMTAEDGSHHCIALLPTPDLKKK